MTKRTVPSTRWTVGEPLEGEVDNFPLAPFFPFSSPLFLISLLRSKTSLRNSRLLFFLLRTDQVALSPSLTLSPNRKENGAHKAGNLIAIAPMTACSRAKLALKADKNIFEASQKAAWALAVDNSGWMQRAEVRHQHSAGLAAEKLEESAFAQCELARRVLQPYMGTKPMVAVQPASAHRQE